MSFLRVHSLASLGILLAACEGSTPPPAPASPSPPAKVSPAQTAAAPAEPAAPVKAEVPPAEPTASETELMTDSRNANTFTLKVLARTKKPTENAMVSGTSIRTALGTTYLGARGTTAKEIASALGFAEDPKGAAKLAHAELDAWKDARGKSELNVASRIWVEQSFPLQPDYVKTVESVFGAPVGTVEYAKPEDARKTINVWVSEKTKDKIKDLLPQGSVDPKTRLIVTNAIWFKGAWEFPFPTSGTKDEAFKVDAKKSVTAPLMHLTDTFRFVAQPGVKVLELRYAESQLAMLIVLPDEGQSLAKLETSLAPETLEKWTAALATSRVNVTLPRFTFRSGGPMSATLQDLGMKMAFTDKADFGGMVMEPRKSEPLFLSQVFHQTWINVDELGTEAAAATGGVMRTTSLMTGPIADFKADHPFLFFIRETRHGRILFAGRVADPKAS